MDADDVHNIEGGGGKPHDLSDADAVTQHIYSSQRLWETEIPRVLAGLSELEAGVGIVAC